jgi:hypothetical protein
MSPVKEMKTNASHTVGIVKIKKKTICHMLPGTFDKNLIKEAINIFLDNNPGEHIKIGYIGEDNVSMLIFKYLKGRKAIAICGRYEE